VVGHPPPLGLSLNIFFLSLCGFFASPALPGIAALLLPLDNIIAAPRPARSPSLPDISRHALIVWLRPVL
jgi:hypothetical protein